MEFTWAVSGLSGAPVGQSCPALVAVWEVSWGRRGAVWGNFGSSWSHLGLSCRYTGQPWRPWGLSWAVVAFLESPKEAPWLPLAPSLGRLAGRCGNFEAVLGESWRLFGLCQLTEARSEHFSKTKRKLGFGLLRALWRVFSELPGRS